MPGTPIDTAIELRAPANLTATENTTPVEVEGPADGELHLAWETPTGTTPTLTAALQARIDGTNWVTVMSTRQFVAADAPGPDEGKFHISRPVNIPGSVEQDAYAGSLHRSDVRLALTVGGTTPNFVNFHAWLAPRDTGVTRARERL